MRVEPLWSVGLCSPFHVYLASSKFVPEDLGVGPIGNLDAVESLGHRDGVECGLNCIYVTKNLPKRYDRVQEELICGPRAECNRGSSIMNSLLPLKVLIISDSDEKAAELVSHLVNDGFEVVSLRIQTPEAFLTALRESAWDVVLSGYPVSGFKEMQGLELVKARENPPPFLFVTDVECTDMAAAALRGGARDSLVIGDGKHFVAAVERELRDAELHRERQRLERQVHLSKRFEAIGRLAGGIAHDFNNVLAGILGSIELELQSRSLPKDARIRGRLERMQAQAKSGKRLTGQLLAFARRQVLAPSNLDLNRLVSDTCALLEKMVLPNLHIERRLSRELPPAWADESQIEQVIMNLCLNARDAMPEGGTLGIETKPIEFTAKDELVHPYFKPGSYVALFIRDAGMGMEPAVVERIFEPFFTTKGEKGTGLGLATVYGIVKQHNGIIHVESEPKRGTTFKVYLPVGTGVPEMPSKTSSKPARRGSETVLLVDDNEDVCQVLREMLERWGYHVLVASSVGNAAATFRKHWKSIELAVVDVGVAGTNGVSALARIKERRFDLPTILTTGYAEDTTMLAAALGPRVQVLHKPFDSRKLNDMVRQLLDRGC